MAEKKPLLDVVLGLISREIGASLQVASVGVRAVKADKIRCWLQCLAGAQLAEDEAKRVCGTLHLLAVSARTAKIEIAVDLDAAIAKLVQEHHLPAASV